MDVSSDKCLVIPVVKAEGIKQVYFGPFKNQQSSSSEDTVGIDEFSFNLELAIGLEKKENNEPLFSNSDQISCSGIYSITNISNISVLLLEPFSGIPAGTNISYLLITPNGQSISQLKEFDRVPVYVGTKLNFHPKNISQLKTRTFLFLRDGTRFFLDSSSPYLKPR